jgi:predicted transcriptional regulator YdeE
LHRHASLLARRGAGRRDRAELDETLDSLGAAVEIGVSRDAVSLSGLALSRHLDAVIDLAADILADPRFDEEEHARLLALSDTEPAGLLQVCDDLDPDRAEGSELTYVHGVAVPLDTEVPTDLDTIEVPAGRWAVFGSSGPYPDALQQIWAATATEWFPSNPWRLRPGPEIVAVLERADDFSTARCELWLPVEPA